MISATASRFDKCNDFRSIAVNLIERKAITSFGQIEQSSSHIDVRSRGLREMAPSGLGCDSCCDAQESPHCVEHDFAGRPRPQTLQHLVGLSSIFKRENPADVYEKLLRIEEIRDFPEVLGVDIHQDELGLDPGLLGERRIGHGD